MVANLSEQRNDEGCGYLVRCVQGGRVMGPPFGTAEEAHAWIDEMSRLRWATEFGMVFEFVGPAPAASKRRENPAPRALKSVWEMWLDACGATALRCYLGQLERATLGTGTQGFRLLWASSRK